MFYVLDISIDLWAHKLIFVRLLKQHHINTHKLYLPGAYLEIEYCMSRYYVTPHQCLVVWLSVLVALIMYFCPTSDPSKYLRNILVTI